MVQFAQASLQRACTTTLVLLALILIAAPVQGQILRGKWVDESEALIERHRKTDLTVIVLDRHDRTVVGADVKVQQLRHDFAFGLAVPADQKAPEGLDTKPVYRCFNAVSLERVTDWSPNDQGENAGTLTRGTRGWLDAIDPVQTVFGRVVSADPAMNDDDLLLLEPAAMRDVLLARIDYATSFEPAPDTYDLYSDLIYQDLIKRRLGGGMVHRMFDAAHAKRPGAGLNLRMRDAVSLQRGREMVSVVRRLEARQIPFDGVTIEQRFSGQLQPLPLQRMMYESVGRLAVPATLVGLEVGGTSAVAAGLNMEVVLRLAFSQETIQGLYFAGLTEAELTEEHAALVGTDGRPTPAGRTLDTMLTQTWWTSGQGVTDERGNVDMRVFTGWYEITATLPEGQVIRTKAYVPKGERPRLVVLQQTLADE